MLRGQTQHFPSGCKREQGVHMQARAPAVTDWAESLGVLELSKTEIGGVLNKQRDWVCQCVVLRLLEMGLHELLACHVFAVEQTIGRLQACPCLGLCRQALVGRLQHVQRELLGPARSSCIAQVGLRKLLRNPRLILKR